MTFCSRCGKELDADAAFCPRCGTPAAAASQAGAASQASVSGIDRVIKEHAAQEYWFERIVAFVIDAAIVYLVVGIVAFAFALPFFFTTGITAMLSMIAGAFSLVAGIVLVLYFSIFEVSSGTSFGKTVMGLLVRSKEDRNPNFGEAFVRNLSKVYWILLLLDIIVGLATSKEYTQKFSDRFVGTSVVKRRA